MNDKKLYLGDSLIKIFSHQKKHNETVVSFPGFRCKYLSSASHIIYPYNYDYTHIILNFGSNDLLLDYFYYFNNEVDYTEKFIDEIANSYFIFINFLLNKSNIVDIKIIIPFYSPVEDKYFYETLQRYNKKSIQFERNETIYTQSYRNKIIDLFEAKIKLLGLNISKISFININHFITNDKYKLDNKTDMHFKW
jgi:hypothetical protein